MTSVQTLILTLKKTPAEVVNLKLRLENSLSRQLRPFFRRYLEAVALDRARQQTLSQQSWQVALEDVFLEHYLRCIASFRGIDVSGSDDLADVAVVPEQAEWLLGKAEQQARIIYETIHRELAEFEAQTKDSFGRARGLSVGFVSSLRRTGRNLRTRIPLISGQQTQDVVEDTRMRVAVEEGGEGVIKTWITMLDHKVRTAHRFAHGQERPVEEPFNIGGFQLRMPGDGTLGAPLRLLINCRCVARYRTTSGSDPIGETPRLVPARPRRPGERVRPGQSPPLRPSPQEPTTSEPQPEPSVPGYDVVPSGDEEKYVEWADEWAPGVRKNEAVREYMGAGYLPLNRALRGQEEWAVETVERHAKLLDETTSHALPQNVTLFRGQKRDSFSLDPSKLEQGDKIKQEAYTSTTMWPDIATNFASGEGDVVWRLKAPQGTPAAPVWEGEAEILFPPGTEFSVENVTRQQVKDIPGVDDRSYDKTRVWVIDAILKVVTE